MDTSTSIHTSDRTITDLNHTLKIISRYILSFLNVSTYHKEGIQLGILETKEERIAVNIGRGGGGGEEEEEEKEKQEK